MQDNSTPADASTPRTPAPADVMMQLDPESGMNGHEVVAMFDAKLRGYLRRNYALCAAVPFATKEVADAIQRIAIQRSNRGHISGSAIAARVSELEALGGEE